MRVDIIAFPGMRLAGLQHKGPYEQISNTFASLFPKAGDLGPPRIPDAQWVAVYAADPGTGGDQLRSFATVSVAEDAEIGDLEVVRIAPGTHALTVHAGPHSGLATAWKVFGSRLTDSGHHVLRDRPAFEIYVNQEEGTAESDLLTELYFPVR
jgi:AraC family transcriptional regulator